MDATHAIIVAEASEFGKREIPGISQIACNLLDKAVEESVRSPTVREGYHVQDAR